MHVQADVKLKAQLPSPASPAGNSHSGSFEQVLNRAAGAARSAARPQGHRASTPTAASKPARKAKSLSKAHKGEPDNLNPKIARSSPKRSPRPDEHSDPVPADDTREVAEEVQQAKPQSVANDVEAAQQVAQTVINPVARDDEPEVEQTKVIEPFSAGQPSGGLSAVNAEDEILKTAPAPTQQLAQADDQNSASAQIAVLSDQDLDQAAQKVAQAPQPPKPSGRELRGKLADPALAKVPSPPVAAPKPDVPRVVAVEQALDEDLTGQSNSREPPAEISKSDDQAPAKIAADSHPNLDQLFTAAPTPHNPQASPPSAQPSPRIPAELIFAQSNHPSIVQVVRGQLWPNGGTMQLRLDPPDLGPLGVTVKVLDGAMSASFQTSSDDATRLLSHSLAQLKTALESAGVSIEKLQVQQAAAPGRADGENAQQNAHANNQSAQQEQQRKEILQRMWEKIALGREQVDVTG